MGRLVGLRPERHRVTVSFSDATYETLQGFAAREGLGVPEFIREAILLMKWLADLEREGGRLLIERDGKFTEVERLSKEGGK
jgi:hypothetical protein